MASAVVLSNLPPVAPPALNQRPQDFKCDTGDAQLDSLLFESAFETINAALGSVASIAEDAEAAARRGDNDLENMRILGFTRGLLRATEILYF